jgi:signal peptidase II
VVLFLAVSAGGLAADLLTKHFVFSSMLSDSALEQKAQAFRREYGDRADTRDVLHQFDREVCPGMRFTLSANPGIVFGLSMPRWAVAIATLITVGLVGVFFATSDRTDRLVHLALACVLGGALGNLYDRLYSRVAPLGMDPILRNVRDFINCRDLYYPWIFNVADVLLVVGVIGLAVHWLIGERKRAAPSAEAGSGD